MIFNMNDRWKRSLKFSITIAVITFVLAAIFSSMSSTILSKVSWISGLIIVFIIVIIGIIFDMLGIASTAVKESPLNAMASEKVTGAKEAVIIHKNADKFASFCNDVIGDISGIISGSALTIVIIQITQLISGSNGASWQIILSIIFTSIVAAVTVGGKAVGKYFAINSAVNILLIAGKVTYVIQSKLKIRIFPNK